jgi:hypothetical protein
MRRSRCSALLTVCTALVACASAPAPARAPPRCSDERLVLASQVDVASVAGCSTIRNLVIRTGGNLDLSALRAPLAVAGDLVIGPTVAIEQVTLPGLRAVDGSIRVVGNGLLQGLFLPALERAGGIEIDGNVAVTTISLPRLATTRGGLAITDNASLEMVDAPMLLSIGGDLVIAASPKLSLFDAPQLARTAAVRLDAPALPVEVAARLQATAPRVPSER